MERSRTTPGSAAGCQLCKKGGMGVIEHGNVPLDFALSEVLDEVGATFRPLIAEKNLAFTENRHPGLPVRIHSDPDRLRQVLINLLSNAVKFMQEGSVTLVVQPAAAPNVRFEVIDTGIGIAEGELRDIFLAFHQVRYRKLAVQGTGPGLAISQHLVGLFGGRIEVESIPGRLFFERRCQRSPRLA